ncbi:MAG: threonylcarbamoyl-AMP synthase [Deltaproteobacteria bacterium]|nr:threonylcarbamoyl-AMP synthase [Deltaproteobacteria bacterium]
MTEILKINPKSFTFRDLEPALRTLLGGGIIAGATESYYGLMVLPDQPKTLERLSDLKSHRGSDDAFLLLVDSRERVRAYAQEIPLEAEKVMERFWPGLLTILLTAQSTLHPTILGKNRSTVGLRLDAFPLSASLVRMADRAVTGTSANPHGLPPAQNKDTVLKYFQGQVDLIIDTGPAEGGLPSTVIDLSKSPFSLVREGKIPSVEVFRELNK